LGPILFIIFINDVCDIIVGNTRPTCKLFADDINLYAYVDFNGISHDLNASLDNLMLWSNMWQLKVNINKCNVLRIGKSCVLGDYSFNCDVLPRVEKVADLGIIVSKNVAFSDYIHECTSKVFSRSFLIFKGFSSRNSHLLVKAFTTYIRPLLEYNIIWSSHDVYITKIETVQRRFTKRIPSVSHLSYSERLEFLGLEPLEYRRLIAGLTMMYKIVHNLVDVDRNAHITLNSTSVARNSFLKLHKQTSLSSVHAQFLCMRCLNAWDYRPQEARSSTSVTAFENSLFTCNLTNILSVL